MNPNKLNRNPSKTKSNLIKINSNPRCRANCSGPYSMRPSHICLHLSLRTQSRTNRKKYALLCVNVSGYCVQLCCPSRPQPFFCFRGLSRGGVSIYIYIYIYIAAPVTEGPSKRDPTLREMEKCLRSFTGVCLLSGALCCRRKRRRAFWQPPPPPPTQTKMNNNNNNNTLKP